MSEPEKERQALLAHLTQRAAKFRGHARSNDRAATLCYFAAIAGSLAATLCAAVGDLPRWAIAAITAIPGTALLANSAFAFDKKSRWHRKRKLKYDAFILRLTYEDDPAATISKELREFEEKFDADYPRFGPLVERGKETDSTG